MKNMTENQTCELTQLSISDTIDANESLNRADTQHIGSCADCAKFLQLWQKQAGRREGLAVFDEAPSAATFPSKRPYGLPSRTVSRTVLWPEDMACTPVSSPGSCRMRAESTPRPSGAEKNGYSMGWKVLSLNSGPAPARTSPIYHRKCDSWPWNPTPSCTPIC